MPKDSVLHVIKKTKKRFLKSLMKDIKMFLKKEKTKKENMVANDIKISQKKKSKG